MTARSRYGDDPELTRLARRAAVRVLAAMAVTALFVSLAVVVLAVKLGLHSITMLGQAARVAVTAPHWAQAVGVVLLLATGSVVVGWTMRGGGARRLPPGTSELPPDHRARLALARLCSLADLPSLPLLVLESDVRDAFVVDRVDGGPVVVVTSSALAALEPDELDVVLAHELFHVAHGDTRLVARLDELARLAGRRAPRSVSDWVLASVRGMMRQRELSADRAAALLTGRPTALVSALRTCLDEEQLTPHRDLRSLADVAFVGPRSRGGRAWADTHPTLEERVTWLARVAAQLGQR